MSSKKKSCNRCCLLKKKCKGGEPCPGCIQSGVECVFSPRKKRKSDHDIKCDQRNAFKNALLQRWKSHWTSSSEVRAQPPGRLVESQRAAPDPATHSAVTLQETDDRKMLENQLRITSASGQVPVVSVKRCGSGASGTVYRCKITRGPLVRVCAVKIAHQAVADAEAGLMKEWNILRMLHGHTWIPTLLDKFWDTNVLGLWLAGNNQRGSMGIVMEYLDPIMYTCSLKHWENQTIPLARVFEFIDSLLQIGAELHGLGIEHRDLKPGNCYWTTALSGTCKVMIGDFGGATMFADSDEACSIFSNQNRLHAKNHPTFQNCFDRVVNGNLARTYTRPLLREYILFPRMSTGLSCPGKRGSWGYRCAGDAS